MTFMEVGGAYAHLFFELLDFLELCTSIITDLDAVEKPGGEACAVHQGKHSSNECLKAWFKGDHFHINFGRGLHFKCTDFNLLNTAEPH